VIEIRKLLYEDRVCVVLGRGREAKKLLLPKLEADKLSVEKWIRLEPKPEAFDMFMIWPGDFLEIKEGQPHIAELISSCAPAGTGTELETASEPRRETSELWLTH
jgi:hypothetical protein